nr:hypothetical protein CFP56_13204 [Quercus suber]
MAATAGRVCLTGHRRWRFGQGRDEGREGRGVSRCGTGRKNTNSSLVAPEDLGDGRGGAGHDLLAAVLDVGRLDDDDPAVEQEGDADEQLHDRGQQQAEPGVAVAGGGANEAAGQQAGVEEHAPIARTVAEREDIRVVGQRDECAWRRGELREPDADRHGDLAARGDAQQRQQPERGAARPQSWAPGANGGGGEHQQRLEQVHEEQPEPPPLLDAAADVAEEGGADDERGDGHRYVLLHALGEDGTVEGVEGEKQGVAYMTRETESIRGGKGPNGDQHPPVCFVVKTLKSPNVVAS